MFNTPYIFKDPLWFLALLAIPAIMWLRSRRTVPVLIVPFAAAWHRASLTGPSRWPVIFASLGIVLITIALARPQKVEDKREVRTQGYDLMLSIDLSGSMYSEDFTEGGTPINRLQAIKPVIKAFINDRPSDRIGVVLFAGHAYTLAPLTFDHDWLARQIEQINIGLIEDGTAIGDGLGVALTRLEQSERTEDGNKRKGAFVILLTDGANNRGMLSPQQATEIAKERNIPVYTIGAGREGWVPFPVLDQNRNRVGTRRVVSDLDEETLRTIARETGGLYFRARDNNTIKSAFAAIDRAQKIEFQAKSYLVTTEYFHWFAIPGGALFLLAALLTRLNTRASFRTPSSELRTSTQ
ncbi:Ca-activated chloride channel family protein [Ereboglobus sp. PH5-5]|uniref:vWA domain-containing protein n=1 Tax=Ereboglobus sp. PH5-5 TaxID=2940529 RepID=UPI0024051734|nr:VWA domain-containing protein [Ereboglobus sp. PH5-5]MDF9833031.1 Ca-activated chloride channel family protein [Ereboglobus sp. PH5-5]